MLAYSFGRTTHRSTDHAFLFICWHSSFRRYLKAINIVFFSPQASHPDAWPGSPAPLNMKNYGNKKSTAESMLDVTLLMATASQLKAVLEQELDSSFNTRIVTKISISLCLQVTVGVLPILIGEKINTTLVKTRGVSVVRQASHGLFSSPPLCLPARFNNVNHDNKAWHQVKSSLGFSWKSRGGYFIFLLGKVALDWFYNPVSKKCWDTV